MAKPPAILRDLRVVYRTGGAEGSEAGLGPQQLVLWRMLKAEPDKFLTRLSKAEAEYRERLDQGGGKNGAGSGGSPPPVGENERRVLEAIERLLGEMGGKPWEAE